MRDQEFWVDLSGLHGLYQHRGADCIDQARRDCDVMRPEAFEMKIGFGAERPTFAITPPGRNRL